MGGYSWVTLATNDSYSLGALVLAHSLKQVGTKQKLSVLITPGVTNAMRSKLSEVFDVVQEVNILDSKDEANLRLLKRPELGVTFTKLHCWRLTQFDKCVFLDADTLVLENCDELFDREELSAAPDIGWPDCFNSGVFVYRPSNETYEKLIEFALEKGSFDGGDQGLLNLFFSDWAHKDISKHLPFIYNMASTACYSYLPAFKQFGGTAKIIHFIGTSKPWLQYFDTETKQVHPTEGYEHLRVILQHWWDIFCSLIHPCLSPDMAGIAGAFAKLTLGQPRTPEQLALDDHLRRQGWEVGKIDYLGRDSFDNIWNKICETLSSAPAPPPAPKAKDPSPSRSEVKEVEQPPSEVKTDIKESSEAINQSEVTSAPSKELEIASEAPQILSKPTSTPPPTEKSPLPPSDLSKIDISPKQVEEAVPISPIPLTESSAQSEPVLAPKVSEALKLEATKSDPQKPITEPTQPVTELSGIVSEQPKVASEQENTELELAKSKQVAEPQKPASQTPKPAEEPLKPSAESPTPVTEPQKLGAEPPKPVAEPPKATPEPIKPVTEPPKLATEVPKPVTEPLKPAEEQPKLAVEQPKPAVELPKPAVELPKPAVELPKPAEASKSVPLTEPAKSATETAKPATDSAKPATEPAKPVAELPGTVAQPSAVTETSKPLTEPVKKVVESSPKPEKIISPSPAEKPVAESVASTACPVKPKQLALSSEKDSKKVKEIPKTQVTETTTPTTPASPQPKQTKQALSVDTSVPDTPPPATQESATAGPTPPPRKSSSGTKKSGTKSKK